MIEKLTVNSFKSLESVEVDLGQVNVFIGANGSGKSNLLEALGVLSAAADGKVNDQTLLQRGVRPGVPSLYKSAFSTRMPPHISFAAANSQCQLRGVASRPAQGAESCLAIQDGAVARRRDETRRTLAGHEIETEPRTRRGRAQGPGFRFRFAGPEVIETPARIYHLRTDDAGNARRCIRAAIKGACGHVGGPTSEGGQGAVFFGNARRACPAGL